MKIGKTVKIVKSPNRVIRKYDEKDEPEKEEPIPVQIPVKKEQEQEAEKV